MKKYYFFHGDISEVVFLRQYSNLFDSPICSFYINPESQKNLRFEFDGLITMVGKINGREVGLLGCDFKIYGGSFGVESSDRVCAFLKEMRKREIPVVFFLETIGVRIMEGRKVFPHAFKILKELKDFSEENLFLTAARGSCLGLWALEGANIGIMGNQIISKLLGSSKRLHSEWEESSSDESEDLSDFVNAGIIDKVISVSEFNSHFSQMLSLIS